jgi:excisionase family DNA binding protein
VGQAVDMFEGDIVRDEIGHWDDAPLVMTAEEVADLIRVDRMTIYKALASGGIPGRKVGRQWRIARDELRAWWSTR